MRKFILPLLAFALVAMGTAAAPLAVLHSALQPILSAQPEEWQGQSCAVDGNIVVVGAPNSNVGATKSGVVKVYDATTGVLLHTLVNPAPAQSDAFGSSVAISESRVVVGVPQRDIGAVSGAGAAYVYDLASATPTTPFLSIPNPTPAEADMFGYVVAVSGSRVVVGVLIGPFDPGAAYVYDMASPNPTVPAAVLTNPVPTLQDLFGWSVAVSGSRVVVGANGSFGAAYVFDLAGPTPHVPAFTLNNPTPVVNDYFGVAVGISGSRVVVGARFDEAAGTNAGSAYVYDLTGLTPTVPLLTLTNPSPQSGDAFGTAVAIYGTRAVIAAHRDDTDATDAGIAYVFDLNSATPFIPAVTLPNPSPASGDVFGRSVAISGTRVVVGASLDDTRAVDAGSAYVYDLAGLTPAVPTATLNVPNAVPGDQFGISVGVSGMRMVVGANLHDTGATNAGVVHVYNLAGAAPALPVLTLTNPTPAVDDWFGFAVAISGTRVVAGAYQDDQGATNSGVVHVFNLTNPVPGLPVLTLTNPSPAQGDFFGYTVAASGSRVVVGAQRDDTGSTDAGAAYVYDLAGATPAVPAATLNNPSPAVSDLFGWAVGISGTRVVVGVPMDDAGALNAGIAYVYDLAGATPTIPVVTLTNPSPASFDGFGSSVAISGTRIVVGNPKDDTGATDAGNAYVYDLTSATPTTPVATLTNPSPNVNAVFGSAVAISGSLVVVGKYLDDTGALNAGIAYVYDLGNATPTLPVATLQSPSPAVGDWFGYSVAIDGAAVVVGEPFDDTNAQDRGAAYAFVVRPALSIAPAAPGFATLSWTPTNAPGFVLKYTDSLAPTNWLNAPSGATNPVTIPKTNAARFYRVAQP